MDEPKPQCGADNVGPGEDYDLPLHVAAVFIVFAASILGAGFPVVAKKVSWVKVPEPVFFACKHFGTGVLVATAFVHLVPTAFGSLTNPCLPDLFTDIYPAMPGAIMMGSMFALFVIEMWLTSKIGGHSHGGPTGGQIEHHVTHHHQHHDPRRPGTADSDMTLHIGGDSAYDDEKMPSKSKAAKESEMEQNFLQVSSVADQPMPAWFVVFYEQYIRQRMEMMELINADGSRAKTEEDLKGVSHVHVRETFDEEGQTVDPMVLKKMNLNISLLEGGILFHSIFVGITISITSEGFIVLLVAILFHQMFEGIGLGSRIAAVPYPKKSIRPWVLVCAFGLTCPIGQAIGLVTRNSYDPDSAYGLIMVGVFNAISSGLLIYAALVDLLAEDFLSEESQRVLRGKTRVEAFFWVVLGALGMSVVGAFA